jgi:uncharacterized protein (DUF1330 family)
MTQHMPDPSTLERLREGASGGPIVLLNLLRYHTPGGREAFARYSQITGPLITESGGEVIFAGKAGPVLTGSETDWDDALLVRFPSAERFLSMIESDTYTREAAPIRAEALAATLWMAIEPFPPFAGS